MHSKASTHPNSAHDNLDCPASRNQRRRSQRDAHGDAGDDVRISGVSVGEDTSGMGRVLSTSGTMSASSKLMNSTPQCPKCQTQMGPGYIMDRTHHSSQAPATWVEGEPEPSFWWGTKIAGKEQVQVHTFRCPKCGYLESYAR